MSGVKKVLAEIIKESWTCLADRKFYYPASVKIRSEPINGTEELEVHFSNLDGMLANLFGGLVRLVLALCIFICLWIIGCNVKQCTVGALNEDLDNARKEMVSLCDETARLGEAVKALDGGISRLDGNVRQLSDEASAINNKFGCVRQLHSMLASISNNVSEVKATVKSQCCGWCLNLKTDKSNDR